MDIGNDNGLSGGVPISEAADVLGLSVAATRKRVKRGTLEAYKAEDGTWQVIIPEEVKEEHDVPSPASSDSTAALVEALRDEVTFLRAELTAERESRAEADRRRDILFSQFGDQLKMLSQTTTDVREQVAAVVEEVIPEPVEREPAPPQQPISWWRRILLGER